jgi:E3 ubiquitin-protein ligase synoviolin
MGLFSFPAIFLLTSATFVSIVVKLWMTTHRFFDVCIALQEEPAPRLFGVVFLAVVIFGFLRLCVRWFCNDLNSTEHSRVVSELQKIIFDMAIHILFSNLTDNQNLLMALLPLACRYIVLCLRERVTALPLSVEPPSLKLHHHLFFGQVVVLYACVYEMLWLSRRVERDYYVLLLVQLVHAITDEVHDLIRHIIFVTDRDNNGNSSAAYRIVFLAELIASIISLLTDGCFLVFTLWLQRLPLQVLRPAYDTWKKLKVLSGRYITWRRMLKFIETALPAATEEDLKRDDTCMVCRLPMQVGDVRRLPCGHCLHAECLERWIGQQTKCPTCQADLKDYLEEAERNAANRDEQQAAEEHPEDAVFKYEDLVGGVSD